MIGLPSVAWYVGALVLFVVIWTRPVDASVEAMRLQAGFPGFYSNQLPLGDHVDSGEVGMGFTISFGDPANHYSTLLVNNDGSVSFGEATGSQIPFSINDKNLPMFAPFLSDVDTTSASGYDGKVWYGQDTVDGRNAFAVTWSKVRPVYSALNPEINTFQLVLIERNDLTNYMFAFDAEFDYQSITWDIAPQSSKQIGPYVGLSDGDPADQDWDFELAGSGHGKSVHPFLDSHTPVAVPPDPDQAGLKYLKLIYDDLHAAPLKPGDSGFPSNFPEGRILFQIRSEVIPEPSALLIWSVLGMAGIGLGQWRRKRRGPSA